MPQETNIERIALMNFGGIGDEILFSPVIRLIREAFPDAHLTLILESRSHRIKELLPDLDSVIDLDIKIGSRTKLFERLLRRLRGRHFDAVISSGSSPFISVLLWLSGIPIKVGFDSGWLSQCLLTKAAPLDRKIYAADMYFSLARTFLSLVKPDFPMDETVIPELSVDPASHQKMRTLLESVEDSPPEYRIFIHPGVSQMSIDKNILKSWPIESWKSLLEALPERYPNAKVYLVGGPDDAEALHQLIDYCQNLPESIRANIINLYGKTANLRDLASLFSIGDLVISVDSAPMHMAVGLATPLVAIFAPTDEKKLLPEHSQFLPASRTDLACRPCLWDVRQTSCANPICLQVSVHDVLERIDSLLKP